MLEFSSGCDLFGYPSQLSTTANWQVNGTGCGTTAAQYTTYALALAAAGSTHVTSAYIVADGDQAPGTTDTITAIQYGGEGVSPVVHVAPDAARPRPPDSARPWPADSSWPRPADAAVRVQQPRLRGELL